MARVSRRSTIASAVIALAVAAAPASAQEMRAGVRAEWCGFPGGGLVFTRSTENAVPDFTNYALGTSLTWNLNAWVGLEGEAGFGIGTRHTITAGGRLLSSQPMPDTAAYSGNIVVNPVGSARFVVPYVTGGVGAFAILPRDGTEALGITERQTLFTGNVGGGVKWYPSRGWGLRGDYRLIMLNHQDEVPLLLGEPGVRRAHRVYGGVFATF